MKFFSAARAANHLAHAHSNLISFILISCVKTCVSDNIQIVFKKIKIPLNQLGGLLILNINSVSIWTFDWWSVIKGSKLHPPRCRIVMSLVSLVLSFVKNGKLPAVVANVVEFRFA